MATVVQVQRHATTYTGVALKSKREAREAAEVISKAGIIKIDNDPAHPHGVLIGVGSPEHAQRLADQITKAAWRQRYRTQRSTPQEVSDD